MSCTWPPLAVLTMPGADCGAAGELRAESPSPLKSLRVCQHLLPRSLLAGTTSQRGLLVSARPDQRIPSPGNPAGVGPPRVKLRDTPTGQRRVRVTLPIER
jgi:hypothetical protein